jgi:thiamine transporter
MKDTRMLVETAILIALAFVLEVAFSFLPAMPQGGRISLSMLPIIVLTWRRGINVGMIGGAVFGLLNLMLDGVIYHWASVFLDYVIAFGAIGLAGFTKKLFGNNAYSFGLLIVFAYVFRFISHVISGVVLFGEWAPAGQNVWIYSIVYNGTYLLPGLILTLVVGIAVYFPLKNMNDIELYE